MTIYGTALLSACLICGLFIGKSLGRLCGLQVDLGGVGIAMVLLMVVTGWLKKKQLLNSKTEAGITYWSAIYIPIVVAMAAGLNVRGAIRGGPAALLAGVLAVAACFALVPVISRWGKP
ncbi:malonate transporter subunit MadL [Luteolibacter pohnpeiensis]|uniref:Malonate transporter subunit MadL n=1 Tax=Luteolibacter pohnpeiensis TaxID=454153 RepID=A0A934S8I2_9BACT|nr:malonate transporter subunit MadL [Luteolibacter pohnpeiensis]MBK1883290.1 malonate transporter subunit MadL [Luteolibacter pohnpeiensis]